MSEPVYFKSTVGGVCATWSPSTARMLEAAGCERITEEEYRRLSAEINAQYLGVDVAADTAPAATVETVSGAGAGEYSQPAAKAKASNKPNG